jgi:hypothetical protein
MKRILLPFLFLASAVSAHPEQMWVIHPQANIQYPCPIGSPVNACIQTACSYATPYSCRVFSSNFNSVFIETYVPQTYVSPVVILPTPVVVTPSPVVVLPPIISVFSMMQPAHKHEYRHRPRRR